MAHVTGLLPASSPRTDASLWAGALSQVLSYGETGCPHSARRAADLLARLADKPDLDRELRELCDRASQCLEQDDQGGRHVLHP